MQDESWKGFGIAQASDAGFWKQKCTSEASLQRWRMRLLFEEGFLPGGCICARPARGAGPHNTSVIGSVSRGKEVSDGAEVVGGFVREKQAGEHKTVQENPSSNSIQGQWKGRKWVRLRRVRGKCRRQYGGWMPCLLERHQERREFETLGARRAVFSWSTFAGFAMTCERMSATSDSNC